MKEINREELCREFCELNGIHWHEYVYKEKHSYLKCSCGHRAYLGVQTKDNPTFPDAKSILEVIKKHLNYKWFASRHFFMVGENHYIRASWVIDSDKFLQVAVEFCKENPISDSKS